MLPKFVTAIYETVKLVMDPIKELIDYAKESKKPSLKQKFENMIRESLRISEKRQFEVGDVIPTNPIDKGIEILNKAFPIRWGMKAGISASAFSGKTRLLQNYVKSLDTSKINVFVLQIGERPEEIDDWKRANVTGTYMIPITTVMCLDDKLEEALDQIQNFLVDFEKSDKDTVVIIDSATRLIDWLPTRLSVVHEAKSGGLKADSFDLVNQLVYLAGTYSNKKVTTISTLLSAQDKAKSVIVEAMTSILNATLPIKQPENGKTAWEDLGLKISIDWKSKDFSYRFNGDKFDKIANTFKSNTSDEINEILSRLDFDLNQF
jgi:flagellar biosynthesis/type III secretory pathway ATPase